jgi:membrane protein DedA with SNARE-associated domain
MHIILIYIGIFAGIFLEGEMIMISSVIAAHHGHLDLSLVVAIGFVATFSADMFYYHLGRIKGEKWLTKKKVLASKVEKVRGYLQKRLVVVLLTYRFMYGFRTITPFLMGVQPVKRFVFILFSISSTLIWCTVISACGLLIGEALKRYLKDIEEIELYAIAAILLTGILIYSVRIWRRDRLVKA